MVPRTLNEWTKDVVLDLLTKGIWEAESFDWKVYKTTRKSDPERQDIRKDCCAFANSQGGFLVYGVDDNRTKQPADRMVGVDPGFDFNNDFGAFPSSCRPSVRWEPKNPPIPLDNGNVVHIVWLPRSWRGPHCIPTEKPQEGMLFPKRTNKGNEFMNYEEVRMAVLGYYEKLQKLHLLRQELQDLSTDLEMLLSIPDDRLGDQISTTTLDTSAIEAIVIDTCVILNERPELVQILNRIRGCARRINNQIAMMMPHVHSPLSNKVALLAAHNREMRGRVPALQDMVRVTLAYLENLLR